MRKKCFKCGVIKALEMFYAHPATADRHLNKCKHCTKKDVHERYYDPANRDKIIAYEKLRTLYKERREKRTTYQRNSRAKHRGKFITRQRTSRAVKIGKLKKTPCILCGNEKVEAHHTDYRKPYDVQWLCRKHHRVIENKLPF